MLRPGGLLQFLQVLGVVPPPPAPAADVYDASANGIGVCSVRPAVGAARTGVVDTVQKAGRGAAAYDWGNGLPTAEERSAQRARQCPQTQVPRRTGIDGWARIGARRLATPRAGVPCAPRDLAPSPARTGAAGARDAAATCAGAPRPAATTTSRARASMSPAVTRAPTGTSGASKSPAGGTTTRAEPASPLAANALTARAVAASVVRTTRLDDEQQRDGRRNGG